MRGRMHAMGVVRWRRWRCALLLSIAALTSLMSLSAWAHKASGSYLSIELPRAGSSEPVKGRWDIALRDLDFALGLDADGDGELTWGEIRSQHAQIAAFAREGLSLFADGRECTWEAGEQVGEQQIDEHTDGRYTVLPVRWDCAGPIHTLSLRYSLFADLDPQHRGLLKLHTAQQTRTAVLGGEAASVEFRLDDGDNSGVWRAFSELRDFILQGIWHIWIGFDHILFLISLLLPAVLVRRDNAWQASPSLRDGILEVVKVVTAFTAAHSITLSLAALQWISLPSRWVESAIAASVVLAALNNIWPVAMARRWWVALIFGLIHGFGFAGVLSGLELPTHSLLAALLGFNLGVELGQLFIVVVFMAAAWRLRGSAFYRRGVMSIGSLLIALLALLWLIERALDIKII